MIAREDYVGPITKAAEAMFRRAERRALARAVSQAPTLVRTKPPTDSPIDQVLHEAGLTSAALRHWEAAGVVVFNRRAGRRLVSQEGLARLRSVIALRRAGFTVRQIAQLSPDGPPNLDRMNKALADRSRAA
jgi:hypothetical protein